MNKRRQSQPSTLNCEESIPKVKKLVNNEKNDGYITLDIALKRLKVCKQLSMHQQPLFTRTGLNPIVKNLLAKQEKENN